ncbi:MAG TPA: helix-turn-helix domain-containing protein [Pyrinomonadaceae bacterium]|nr:helix-turn-helix domain-containing protein [Pyrinomonadaceae bacterium]
MNPRVQKVVHLIQKDLGRKVTLPEMAQSVGLSVEHLRALFKSEIGMTPLQYQKRLRLSEAKRLLESTFLNVQEIVVRVGLSDDSHFVRDFKKLYGLTPAQYRARYQQMEKEKRE